MIMLCPRLSDVRANGSQPEASAIVTGSWRYAALTITADTDDFAKGEIDCAFL